MRRHHAPATRRSRALPRPGRLRLTVLVAALVAGGCTGHGGSSASTPSPSAVSSGPRRIPQPPLASLGRATRRRLAPDSRRVDLVMPSFSNPTRVTNPLFPVGRLDAVLVGEVDGQPLKIETTCSPRPGR